MSAAGNYEQLRRLGFVTGQMVRRDIAQRYKGSIGGLFWAMVQPLLMLTVYTVVFGTVLRVKWPGVDSTLEYSLILFLGLVPYMFVSESLSRAPGLVVANANLVKKVVFPLQVLPIMSTATAALHSGVALLVWGAFFVAVKKAAPWAIAVMPLMWLPLILATLGLCWLFAAVGTYFRDLLHAVGPITLALMFLSPIFYSTQMAPAVIRPMLGVNPLGFAIESARDLAFHGVWPDLSTYLMQLVLGALGAWFGLAVFNRARSGFVDTV